MPDTETCRPDEIFSGTCQCGDISFLVKGKTQFCSHCHCYYCRKAHGAAFVTWVGCLAKQVEIVLNGEATIQWYESSEFSRRGFCSRCGSRMFFESKLCPGELHIARAYFLGEIDRIPEQHDFYDQTPVWGHVGKDCPQINTGDASLARYQKIPEGK